MNGPRSLAVAETLNNLAGLWRLEGRGEGAEELLREVLSIRREALPPEHPLLFKTSSNLGVLLMQAGSHDEAEPLLAESLDGARAVLGPDHLEVATHLSNLASLRALQGDLAAAEELRAECLAIRRDRLPADSPLLFVTALVEGELLLRLGRPEEARLLLEEALPPLVGSDYEARVRGALAALPAVDESSSGPAREAQR